MIAALAICDKLTTRVWYRLPLVHAQETCFRTSQAFEPASTLQQLTKFSWLYQLNWKQAKLFINHSPTAGESPNNRHHKPFHGNVRPLYMLSTKVKWDTKSFLKKRRHEKIYNSKRRTLSKLSSSVLINYGDEDIGYKMRAWASRLPTS